LKLSSDQRLADDLKGVREKGLWLVRRARSTKRPEVLSRLTRRITGDWESRTAWHRVVCWSKLDEFAASFKSGAHIQVEGELRSREYQKDGVTHRIWECKASRIAKLDRMERADDNSSADESVENEPPL
jgi:single-stranded DNA-binding protein